jgi:hypothetical protein
LKAVRIVRSPTLLYITCFLIFVKKNSRLLPFFFPPPPPTPSSLPSASSSSPVFT